MFGHDNGLIWNLACLVGIFGMFCMEIAGALTGTTGATTPPMWGGYFGYCEMKSYKYGNYPMQ